MAGMSMALVATLAAALGALVGLFLTGLHRSARKVGSFSGGLLLGVASFGLLPEVISEIGWEPAAILSAAGYALLMLVDRNIYPVCPSCSHDHDHDACATTLHGFAAPLIIATGFHAFLDGWSISTSQWAGTAGLGLSLPLALVLHKIPEGVALGALLRASVGTRVAALGWCLLTESATLLGGGSGLLMAPRLGVRWVHYPLAVAGGCFFYLGFHAIHAEWLRRKTWSAVVPGVTGAAGAALLQHGVRILFR
jgi:zinc transporter ZupT